MPIDPETGSLWRNCASILWSSDTAHLLTGDSTTWYFLNSSYLSKFLNLSISSILILRCNSSSQKSKSRSAWLASARYNQSCFASFSITGDYQPTSRGPRYTLYRPLVCASHGAALGTPPWTAIWTYQFSILVSLSFSALIASPLTAILMIPPRRSRCVAYTALCQAKILPTRHLVPKGHEWLADLAISQVSSIRPEFVVSAFLIHLISMIISLFLAP